uniref:Uncharacterized protein n=1 Tax=Oryza nivara TaxID=4536 RepID=A0A0E0HRT5_ORYNI
MEEDEMRMREKLATMDERQAMEMRLTWISELIASNKKSIAGNKAYILALIDAIDNDRCPYTAAELSDKIRELREDRETVILPRAGCHQDDDRLGASSYARRRLRWWYSSSWRRRQLRCHWLWPNSPVADDQPYE